MYVLLFNGNEQLNMVNRRLEQLGLQILRSKFRWICESDLWRFDLTKLVTDYWFGGFIFRDNRFGEELVWGVFVGGNLRVFDLPGVENVCVKLFALIKWVTMHKVHWINFIFQVSLSWSFGQRLAWESLFYIVGDYTNKPSTFWIPNCPNQSIK